MSGYLVNWSESSSFEIFVHRRSLDMEMEICVQLKVMNTENQLWKISFKSPSTADVDSWNSFDYTVVATPDRRYRYEANFFNLQIVDIDSPTTILHRKALLKENNVFKVTFVDFSKDSKCYKVIVTLGSKHAQTVRRKSISSSLKSMQDQGILTDFAIKTKEGEIHCHKVVLAASSDYFRTMFTTPIETDKILDWEKIFDADTVRDLLHYIYCDSKPPNIENTCLTLLPASHLCLLDDLKMMCVDAIVSSLRVDNVLEVLVMAERYNCLKLKDAALNFIADHADEYDGKPSNIPGWNDMDLDTCKNLLYFVIKDLGNGKKPV